LNRAYTAILSDNTGTAVPGVRNLKTSMLRTVHNGPKELQGAKQKVPLDFHKGPYMHPEDEYVTIYQGEWEIDKDNCNFDLIKTIGDTDITYGMKAYAEGVVWNNALICYNKNSIVIRDTDNKYGQPGYLSGFIYYDKLATLIMHKYIVQGLINKANNKEFDPMTDPATIHRYIDSEYQSVRKDLTLLLNSPDITEKELFSNAPVQEELDKPLDPKDKRIAELEQKVNGLETKLDRVCGKLDDIEDILLELAIKKAEEAMTEQVI
jgi:hypothetical protein